MSEKRIAITYDTTEGKLELEELETASKTTNRAILRNARKTAMILRGLAMASGDAFNEVITLGIEAALMTAELIMDIAAAEASTGVLSYQAFAKTAMIAALIARAQQLRDHRTETAMRTQGIITSLTVFTY